MLPHRLTSTMVYLADRRVDRQRIHDGAYFERTASGAAIRMAASRGRRVKPPYPRFVPDGSPRWAHAL
jgi:hypothetical protein